MVIQVLRNLANLGFCQKAGTQKSQTLHRTDTVSGISVLTRSSVTTSALWDLQDLKFRLCRFDFKAKFLKPLQSGICCLKGGNILPGGAGRSAILNVC